MHIEELILKTNSLQRTKLFYHKTLELETLKETAKAISFKAGKTILTFEQTTEGKPFYHIAFNIVNNKFSDSFEWMNNKLDILPVSDDMLIAKYDNWNAQSFYFLDNNGSILEFITRFDLPYYSSEHFSSACITEVSEIGLVTEDVQGFAEEIKTEYGIPYFKKSPPHPDFSVMGDDYGLLLLVSPKRGWLPTHRAAQKFPVTVKGEGKTIHIE